MKYRKKSAVIEALHFTKDTTFEELVAFFKDGEKFVVSTDDFDTLTYVDFRGRNGLAVYRAGLDGWIVRTEHGALFPCDQETFDANYEAIP